MNSLLFIILDLWYDAMAILWHPLDDAKKTGIRVNVPMNKYTMNKNGFNRIAKQLQMDMKTHLGQTGRHLSRRNYYFFFIKCRSKLNFKLPKNVIKQNYLSLIIKKDIFIQFLYRLIIYKCTILYKFVIFYDLS